MRVVTKGYQYRFDAEQQKAIVVREAIVEVSIDVDEIARRMANAAMTLESGRSTRFYGLIKARVGGLP